MIFYEPERELKIVELSKKILKDNASFKADELGKFGNFCVYGSEENLKLFEQNFVNFLSSNYELKDVHVVMLQNDKNKITNFKNFVRHNLQCLPDCKKDFVIDLFCDEMEKRYKSIVAKREESQCKMVLFIEDVSMLFGEKDLLSKIEKLSLLSKTTELYVVVCAKEMVQLDELLSYIALPTINLDILDKYLY